MKLVIKGEDTEGKVLWNKRIEINNEIQRKQREINALKEQRKAVEEELSMHLLIDTTETF